MYRVKAIDSRDQVAWLNESYYWGSRSDSAVFNRKAAEKFRTEQLARNIYLDPVDRITIELEAQ